MGQLTVRGFDKDLERALRDLARCEGISLNRAALLLMHKGSGLLCGRERSTTVGSSLDHLIGTWTAEEEQEFLEATRGLGQVDEGFWR